MERSGYILGQIESAQAQKTINFTINKLQNRLVDSATRAKSIETHEKLLRHCWSFVGHFCCKYMEQNTPQKLRRIRLLHCGLVTFRFHHGRDRKPLMFETSGFLNVSMTPKTNIIYLWRHQMIPNNYRKSPNHFGRIRAAANILNDFLQCRHRAS